jgi:GNAT superfamily N-acetyltransferase
VRTASALEAAPVARLLTRAFADGPIERWCMECDDPVALIGLELRLAVRQLAPKGWLWTAEDLSAVAAWIPPGSSYDDNEIDALVSPALFEHGGLPERRLRFWEWVEEHRPEARHWYLDLVATDPERQGKGCGSLLLREGLARTDAEGDPCFLVTDSPRTVAWYERHGFAVVSVEPAPDGGPEVWFMVRLSAA